MSNGKGRSQPKPEDAPAASETTTPNPAPTPTPTPVIAKKKSDAIPDDVERGVTWATVLGAAWGFLQSDHGPRVVFKAIREAGGWIGELFGTVADETGKSGQICDQVSDAAHRGTKTQLRKLGEDRAFREGVNQGLGAWDRKSDVPLPTFLWPRRRRQP